MPSNEELVQQQLQKDRTWHAQQLEEDRTRQEATGQSQQSTPKEPVSFPWLMLIVAIIFDIIGMIPFINIASEFIAGLTLFFWQKTYVPKLDPLLSIVTTKLIDFLLGLSMVSYIPSNICTVVIAYIKKKADSKANTLIGKKLISKLSTN